MFVVYSCGDEVIVTTAEKEEEMINSIFVRSDRDIDDYDREEIMDDNVLISISGFTIR